MNRSLGPAIAMSLLVVGCGTDLIPQRSPATQFFYSCFGVEDSQTSAQTTSHALAEPPNTRKRHQLDLFDPNGMARIYDRNPNGALTDVDLELLGDGTLTSSDFVTSTGDIERAHQPDQRFIYDTGDARFAEATLFANATTTLKWYNSLGFDMLGEQVGIGVHSEISGTPNNALYIPGTADGEMSTIRIGDGDGVTIQNLALDRDVISHELGHHVVYRKLKATTGESLVIHEGLADFFTMIRNDDPCLAATICPTGSNLCWQQTQCLRTAANNLQWDDATLPRAPALRSQVLSGMLWDMKTSEQISSQDLAKLVFDAVDLLEQSSSFRHLIDALYQSDERNFQGAHRNLIEETARGRRLI